MDSDTFVTTTTELGIDQALNIQPGETIRAKPMKSGRWRAYWVLEKSTYDLSFGRGGSCVHLKWTPVRDEDQRIIEAPDEDALRETILAAHRAGTLDTMPLYPGEDI